MKTLLRRIAGSLLIFLCVLFSTPASGADKAAPPFSSTRILIKPRATASPESLARLNAGNNAGVLYTYKHLGGIQVVSVPPGESVPSLIERYQQSGLVEFAEPDYLAQTATIPNDFYYTNGTLWGLNQIQAPAGWDNITSASNIIVAVLDSGIRYTHEDLVSNLWVSPYNGSNGVNSITGTYDPADDSVDGHGTQMSGTLGALGNNGKGVVGVAWKVQLMACKCFNSQDQGTNSDIISSMDFARTNGARIINASWSSTNSSLAISNAILALRDAGIIFVTAAGNVFPAVNIDVKPTYPAAYNIDNIVSVAYTAGNDALGVFSNYGATNVDLAAPGESITSTYNTSDSSYVGSYSGTSFAAAYVSGALALLLAEFPGESYQTTIARLLTGVDKLGALNNKCRTGGRLNLRKALTPIHLNASLPVIGGPVQLHVTAATNLTCVVQTSTDLSSWSPLTTNATSVTGSFDYSDYSPTNLTRRYYRVVTGP